MLGSTSAVILTVFLTVLHGVGGVVCFSDAQGPLSALSPAAVWKGTGLGFGRTTMSSRLPIIICVERGQSISFGALFPLEGVGWDSRSKLKYLQGQGR